MIRIGITLPKSLQGVADPTAAQGAATKNYVDSRNTTLTNHLEDYADQAKADAKAYSDAQDAAQNITNEPGSTKLIDNRFVLNTSGSVQRGADGDARENFATDLQISRTDDAQVASGQYSTIGGGQNSLASWSAATVNGGIGNVASHTWATISGGGNGWRVLVCQSLESLPRRPRSMGAVQRDIEHCRRAGSLLDNP